MMIFILNVILLCTLYETRLQAEYFRSVSLGDTVDVNCQVNAGSRTVVWYQLDTSRRLQPVISVNTLKGPIKYTDKNHSVQFSTAHSILTISDIKQDDAGTYYCGVMNKYDVVFGSGTVVVIEGDSRTMERVVQRPDYIRMQPGDSVTLSCSFRSSHCPLKHIRVVWIKNNITSEIISQNTCENSTNTEETTCVHNLTMTQSSDEDGTYLCVVTSCGHTLFGNGTRVLPSDHSQTEEHEVISDLIGLSPPVIALSVVNIVLGVAVIVLGSLVCCIHKEMTTLDRGSPYDNQGEDGVIYAVVNVARRSTT